MSIVPVAASLVPRYDNAPDSRLPAPFRRNAGAWFAWVMVAALFALGLWRAGALG